MSWDPATYNKFQRQREQPFEDLFALLSIRKGMSVIDLGCGTGQLTSQLAERLPSCDVLGIDSSPKMLAAAKALERPGLRFELRSIESIEGTWDLVFSHAAIQWIDDHVRLMHRLFSLVAPGGQLAVQFPDNYGSVPHRLILETAREQPFAAALGGWTRTPPNLPLEQYAELLYAHCGASFTIFAKVYPVVLEDVHALLDWMRGTALLPYLDRLPVELHEAFLLRYREHLAEQHPSGPVFFPFRRILFTATPQTGQSL